MTLSQFLSSRNEHPSRVALSGHPPRSPQLAGLAHPDHYCERMPRTDTSIEHFLGQASISASTRNVYRVHLRDYRAWCDAHSLEMEKVRPADVTVYLEHLRGLGTRESTVTNKFYALKGYYAWLESVQAIQRSPMTHLRARRVEHGPPTSVSIDDLRRLLAVANNDRNWALIAILALNSLRVSELLSCNVRNIEVTDGLTRLRFEPHAPNTRLPYTTLAPRVAEALLRQLEGRKTGPLFLDGKEGRMSRRTAAWVLAAASKRAGLAYRVTPQMLAYTLPVTAIEQGFSYVSVLRAIGVIQPRHSRRWLHHAESLSGQSASSRLTRLVLDPPDDTHSLLQHAEAMLNETEMPDAFAVMGAAAILERHLRLLNIAHDIPVPGDDREGSIYGYATKLRAQKCLSNADMHLIESIAALRNKASHGRFESVPDGVGATTLRTIRELVERHPLPVIDSADPA
jgi:site-specific recombinase XerD